MARIREAKLSDSSYIKDFQIKMAMETENLALDECVVEKGVQAVFQDESKGKYFVAEQDKKIVASLLITYEWSDWRNGRVIWIQSVYVLPEYRGKGIFSMLYEHIKLFIKDQNLNFKGIRLYVDKKNQNAQKVYAQLGMENHHYEMFEWMND